MCGTKYQKLKLGETDHCVSVSIQSHGAGRVTPQEEERVRAGDRKERKLCQLDSLWMKIVWCCRQVLTYKMHSTWKTRKPTAARFLEALMLRSIVQVGTKAWWTARISPRRCFYLLQSLQMQAIMYTMFEQIVTWSAVVMSTAMEYAEWGFLLSSFSCSIPAVFGLKLQPYSGEAFGRLMDFGKMKYVLILNTGCSTVHILESPRARKPCALLLRASAQRPGMLQSFSISLCAKAILHWCKSCSKLSYIQPSLILDWAG